MREFSKTDSTAPEGFFEAEAAGLRWLAEPKAIPVVEVRDVDADGLILEYLPSGRPSTDDARQFGRGLAALHDAGAPAFGFSPSAKSWFGPLHRPSEVPTTPREEFGEFWSADRLGPMLERAEANMTDAQVGIVSDAIDVIATGAFDGIAGCDREKPSRVHGDLWSGNVLWATSDGSAVGTLIDPSAHGGHRLEDLAMLSLFSAPHLGVIYEGYCEAHPLPEGWKKDIPAHVLFGLLAHVYLFGGSYTQPAESAALQTIERARELGAL